VVAFRLPDLADVLAFFVAFRLPDLAAGRVVAFRLPDLAAGRVVAFRLPDLADVPAFFAVVVLAIDCPFRLLLSRRSVRLALGGSLAVVAQCSHPAARLNAPGRGCCSGAACHAWCARFSVSVCGGGVREAEELTDLGQVWPGRVRRPCGSRAFLASCRMVTIAAARRPANS